MVETVGCSILKMSKASLKEHKSPLNGGVAQLGEHLLCKQGVRSSILLISTMGRGRNHTAELRRELKARCQNIALAIFGRIAQVVRAHA